MLLLNLGANLQKPARWARAVAVCLGQLGVWLGVGQAAGFASRAMAPAAEMLVGGAVLALGSHYSAANTATMAHAGRLAGAVSGGVWFTGGVSAYLYL